jgi:phosphatidate phosphatase APP1
MHLILRGIGFLLRLVVRALQVLIFPIRRLGRSRRPPCIMPYRGYGTSTRLLLKGRVLEDTGVRVRLAPLTFWQRLGALYRRLAARAVPEAGVQARAGELSQQLTSDADGFFQVEMTGDADIAGDRLWRPIELELTGPRAPSDGERERTTGHVLVPTSRARFVVISDIDDTVVYTGVANKVSMFWTLFTSPAASRVAFPGVAAFYRALHEGVGEEGNPLLYVSRGPWTIYDVLEEFFHLHDIPVGPVLFLRDWGLSPTHPLPRRQRGHKLALIRHMLATYDQLPFILIGDSGQRDPEIYYEAVREHPGRVLAIYIRNVSAGTERPKAIHALAEKVQEAGSTLILADDSRAMATHAAARGWIRTDALEDITAEKAIEEMAELPVAPETRPQDLGEPETPVVVETEDPAAVAGPAVEQAKSEAERHGAEPAVVVTPPDEGRTDARREPRSEEQAGSGASADGS